MKCHLCTRLHQKSSAYVFSWNFPLLSIDEECYYLSFKVFILFERTRVRQERGRQTEKISICWFMSQSACDKPHLARLKLETKNSIQVSPMSGQDCVLEPTPVTPNHLIIKKLESVAEPKLEACLPSSMGYGCPGSILTADPFVLPNSFISEEWLDVCDYLCFIGVN